ncbi:hypothetical protein [Tomitella gaofuii]|uniref:hypothetical protein n=1 Tax=Tomitella gaofuii TaxID=2760083 RepID=UPI0015FA846B|nr:hypothetical protein [Tomitella gaofuii]
MAPRIIRRTRTLTAAATPVNDPDKSFKSSTLTKADSWQAEAWEFLDEVGELAYYTDWIASSVSRCRLIAVDINPDTGEPADPTDNAAVSQIVRDIGGGITGRAQILFRLAVFLAIPGEGWLAMLSTEDGERWVTVSRDEIRKQSNKITIALPEGGTHDYNTERDLLFRIWNQDPKKASEATSPAKAARKALWEIRRATTRIDNASRSRAVGNGVLFLPHQVDLPDPRPDEDAAPTSKAQRLQDLLFQVGTAASNDPDSLANFLPLMATIPGEFADKVKHVKFDSDVAETSLSTRDSAIRRLAMSLKVSPERLLGLGANSNHWTAWLLDETDVKVHVAPVLETICDAINKAVLRPALERAGLDPDQFTVWYDATPLTQDPDRKTEAKEAYDRGVITAAAYRGYLGFDEGDAPDTSSDEALRELAIKMVTGAPSLLPYLAPVIGIDIAQVDAAPADNALPPADESTSDQEPQTAAARAIIALCTSRALELANKRRRTRGDRATLAGTPMRDAHTILGPCPVEKAREHLAGWADELPVDAITTMGLDPDTVTRVATRIAHAALVSGGRIVVTDSDLAEVM